MSAIVSMTLQQLLNCVYTQAGFSPIPEFRPFLCLQDTNSVFFQVSWQFCVHLRNLYRPWTLTKTRPRQSVSNSWGYIWRINWKKRANKQYETGKNREKQKNWKTKTPKTGKKIDDTERNRKKQEVTLRNGKKLEETGRNRNRQEETGRYGKRREETGRDGKRLEDTRRDGKTKEGTERDWKRREKTGRDRNKCAA